PSAAASVVNPQARTSSVSPSRVAGSSSTINTLSRDAEEVTDLMVARLVAIAEIVLCSSVPTQLLITGLLRAAGWSPLDPSGQLSFSFVVALSVVDTFVLIALMV